MQDRHLNHIAMRHDHKNSRIKLNYEMLSIIPEWQWKFTGLFYAQFQNTSPLMVRVGKYMNAI